MDDDPRFPDNDDSLAPLSGDSVTPDYAAVLDAVSDWTWRTDESGRIVALSAGIAKVTGKPAAAYRGFTFSDWGGFVRPALADLSSIPDVRWRAPFTGPVLAIPVPEGGRRFFALTGTPVFGPADGRFLGYCGNARETVEPDAATGGAIAGEATTGDAAARPGEEAVPEPPLRPDPLRQMTLLSHDIRDPLNAMLGFVQLIADAVRKSAATPAVGAYCDDIFTAAEDMLDRLDEALDLAALQQGAERLQPRPLDLRALAAACVDLVEPLARRKGVEVCLAGSDAALPVTADPGAMRRVLVTLLGNALHHTAPPGRIILDLRSGAGSALVEIRDTGAGLPPERLQRLAASHGESDQDHLRATPETGLGLTISRLLVDAHRGRLTLMSSPGEGTVARLILPLGEAASA